MRAWLIVLPLLACTVREPKGGAEQQPPAPPDAGHTPAAPSMMPADTAPPPMMDAAVHTTTADTGATTPASSVDATVDTGAPAAHDCTPAAQPRRVTLASLLGELTDLHALTHIPDPPYVSKEQSSHDTTSDTATPSDPEWYANEDYLLVTDDSTVTLLELKGPGALTRFWSANPGGQLRIYLDDDPKPIVDAPMQSFLDGAIDPFVAPFAFFVAGGHDLYFPIPFARGCRVTLTGPTAAYYQIAYRTYAPAADVQSYSPQALLDSACERDRAAARLQGLETDPDAQQPPAGDAQQFQLNSAAPDRAAVIEAGAGGSVIEQLQFAFDTPLPDTLRTTILSITFDDEETVRVPLGDFFASGIALSEVHALPISVQASGVLTARWPMPFQHTARIALQSTDGSERIVHVQVIAHAEPWSAQSLYFHAQWHAPETFASEPAHDWNLATIAGAGIYVGDVLNVVNRVRGWWGEGDERIYVDGESFPSHFGTGTEDYFGYAWCENQRFTASYVGQPITTDPQNFGYVSLYRFHVIDAIPFASQLRFDLEVGHWGASVDVTYDAVSFWYARPGSTFAGDAAEPDAYAIPELDAAVPDAATGFYSCY